MFGKTWRTLRRRGYLWLAISMLLPGWAYAAVVNCANNRPADKADPVGTCVSQSFPSCERDIYLVVSCPYQVDHTSWYAWQCKYWISCAFVSSKGCEKYNVNQYLYYWYECPAHTTWTGKQDYSTFTGDTGYGPDCCSS
jgi:hypothetical protein